MTAQSTARAVVIGGASGIGAAVVDPLLARGRRVTVFGLAQNERTEVETTAVALRDEANVEAAWALGPVTGLVACHGIRGAFVSALEMELDRLRRLYDVHVTGTLAVSRAMVRRLDSAPASNA